MLRTSRYFIWLVAAGSITAFPLAGSSAVSSGSPILLLETPAEFGAYAGEILRAEGFNDFQVESPFSARLTAGFLNRFDIVVLTEARLNPAQCDVLTRYVRDGGNLIAFRPDPQLAPVFGIARAKSTISGGCVKIESKTEIGKGLIPEPLQFHGSSEDYNLKGGEVIARVYRDAVDATEWPAVVRHSFGKGHAVAFSYNLPKSIVLTRQGNYRTAGLEQDGIRGIRAADMFAGDWLDPLKTPLNQADEEMHLFAHVLEWAASFKEPLPRLWYFPGLNKSLILLTADGEDSPETDLDAQLSDIKSQGARITLYLKGAYVSPAKVRQWVADGFEIAEHVDDTAESAHPTYTGMDGKMKSAVSLLKQHYGLDMRTVRNHWIVWCGTGPDGSPDFAAQAAIEVSHGIHLDCNFYHFDQGSQWGHFLGPIGNFTGSGLPMKFLDAQGRVLDIYQSITQLPDEQWGRGNLFRNFKLLLDDSLDHERYAFINVNLHTDRWRILVAAGRPPDHPLRQGSKSADLDGRAHVEFSSRAGRRRDWRPPLV